MAKYIYFVSYAHKEGNGCIEIVMDKPINDFGDIEQLCKETIPKKNGLEKIIVLNYQLLRMEAD